MTHKGKGPTGLGFDVPDKKKLRVIVDTDAACEADDPFAIAYALLSPKLIVKGITAEHFREPGSVEKSYEEIKTILRAMDIDDVPAYPGQSGPIDECGADVSPAAEFIIREALTDDPHPLYLLCLGAISNAAMAIKKEPRIIDRIHIIWIGTFGTDVKEVPFREFNAGNDVYAANLILESGADIKLIPQTVYSTMTIGLAEIERRIYPCGKIGKHLFENMITYNMTERADWTQGESWSLGDSPAVAAAINPGCGICREVHAPHINEDTSSSKKEDNPMICEYTYVDSRYVLEDTISKLQLCYGEDRFK